MCTQESTSVLVNFTGPFQRTAQDARNKIIGDVKTPTRITKKRHAKTQWNLSFNLSSKNQLPQWWWTTHTEAIQFQHLAKHKLSNNYHHHRHRHRHRHHHLGRASSADLDLYDNDAVVPRFLDRARLMNNFPCALSAMPPSHNEEGLSKSTVNVYRQSSPTLYDHCRENTKTIPWKRIRAQMCCYYQMPRI
eukprot:scaffold2987_cov170-Amphora_coffeaeformis.AAC.27